jgi:undecaprenyl-diphosphatase
VRRVAGGRFIIGAAGFAAAGLFAVLGAAVRGNSTNAVDIAAQAWVLANQYSWLHDFFLAVTIGGGITAMWIYAVIGTAYLWFRIRHFMAAAVLLAPAITIGLLEQVKRAYSRPRPAGLGSGVDSSYSFPSAHATTSAAICCTLAIAFWREGLISTRTAIALSVLPPLLVGLSRLYLNVHWATDVLGGWSAGLVVAALAGLLYAAKEPHE